MQNNLQYWARVKTTENTEYNNMVTQNQLFGGVNLVTARQKQIH